MPFASISAAFTVHLLLEIGCSHSDVSKTGWTQLRSSGIALRRDRHHVQLQSNPNIRSVQRISKREERLAHGDYLSGCPCLIWPKEASIRRAHRRLTVF